MKIRLATKDDLEIVAAIHFAGTLGAYPAFIPSHLLDRVSIENRLPVWQERFDNEHAIFLASEDGRDIGFCYVIDSPEFVHRKQPFPELSHIFIVPECWNRGVGRKLCEAACNHVREHGAKELRLWTFEAHSNARAAYERWGFKLDGRTRLYNYEGTNFSQVSFAKHLD